MLGRVVYSTVVVEAGDCNIACAAVLIRRTSTDDGAGIPPPFTFSPSSNLLLARGYRTVIHLQPICCMAAVVDGLRLLAVFAQQHHINMTIPGVTRKVTASQGRGALHTGVHMRWHEEGIALISISSIRHFTA